MTSELNKVLCLNMKEFGNAETVSGLMEWGIILNLIKFIDMPSLTLEVRI